MAGKKIDWAIIVQQINNLLRTKFSPAEEIDALRALVKHHDGNITHAAQTIGVAKTTLRRKGIKYQIFFKTKVDHVESIEPAVVYFDEEGWIESGMKHGPCLFCSGLKTVDRRNPTCLACRYKHIFAQKESGEMLSHLNQSSFGDSTAVSTIGSLRCGNLY